MVASRIIKILFTSENHDYAIEQAKNFVEDFKSEMLNAEIEGPIPAMIENLRGVYRFAVLIKTLDLNSARKFLREKNLHLMDSVIIDIDPLTTS